MKATIQNIINLWFGPQTKTWSQFDQAEKTIFSACQEVDRIFSPPSRVSHVAFYRKRDKIAFAQQVKKQLK